MNTTPYGRDYLNVDPSEWYRPDPKATPGAGADLNAAAADDNGPAWQPAALPAVDDHGRAR